MKTRFLKICDILLYKGSGPTSRLIQWGTGSKYTHVAVVVDPEMRLAIESNVGHQAGVHAIDLRSADEAKVDTFRIKPEHTFQSKETLSFLVAHLGAGYDYLGVAWLGVLKTASLLPWVKSKPYNRFQKQKDYFCSELCYEAFLAGGLDIVPDVDAAEITSPGDIAQSDRLEKLGASVPTTP
jgi:uncharacterized protein YycO